jgi:hypothetical protein
MPKISPSSAAKASQPNEVDHALSQLRQEYLAQQTLFLAQSPMVQRYLEAQAAVAANAVIQGLSQVRFNLPDRVTCPAPRPGDTHTQSVPQEQREQMAGGLIGRLTRTDLRAALRQRLLELEQSNNQAVAYSAGLIRYAMVLHMVHNMLPAGHTVTYEMVEGDELPSLPVKAALQPASAITAQTDAIAEEGQGEEGRGELLVPYVEAARRFYLPQWVAFDDQGQLLVGSVNEAEAHVASMQRFLSVLHASVSLAAYIVADDEYQQKRYGILGQLVNQGRLLAQYEVSEIIHTIKHRAAAGDLNRGLSLSLPYFDDQQLVLETFDFEVIPAGRIMFIPAFVVRAAREQEAKVAQDTRLSHSTRRHLLAELRSLEQAFLSPSAN